MKTHLTVIGTVNIGFGVIGFFFGILIIIFFSGVIPIDFGDFPAALIGGIVGTIIILFSIAFITAGAGILKEAPWSRILTLVLSAISLIDIPWGTAWGIYSIWVLVNPETVKIFEQKALETPKPKEPKEPEVVKEEKKEEKEEKKNEDNIHGPAKYAE